MIELTQRTLTACEQDTLDALNAHVKLAMDARRKWLDAKMLECSALKPGDEIFDIRTGRRLGVVRKLYRYHCQHHEGAFDTSVHCDYEYETSPNCFDNTSRQPGLLFGRKPT
jgi:hypothetical protein